MHSLIPLQAFPPSLHVTAVTHAARASAWLQACLLPVQCVFKQQRTNSWPDSKQTIKFPVCVYCQFECADLSSAGLGSLADGQIGRRRRTPGRGKAAETSLIRLEPSSSFWPSRGPPCHFLIAIYAPHTHIHTRICRYFGWLTRWEETLNALPLTLSSLVLIPLLPLPANL